LLTAWLKKDPRESKVYISDYEKPGTKQIVTEYEVLKGGETALLRILLHTGRTHQIRAHMQHIGHPLLGDDAYGDRVFNKTHNARALSLCSVRLKIDTRGKLPEIDGIEVCIKAQFDI